MTTDVIVRFVEARPFIPFEFITADGRILKVPHQDFVVLERFGITFLLYDDAGGCEIFDTSLIVSVRTRYAVDRPDSID
jgi:hypothetical protein